MCRRNIRVRGAVWFGSTKEQLQLTDSWPGGGDIERQQPYVFIPVAIDITNATAVGKTLEVRIRAGNSQVGIR